jgi:CBS domain-containing protein
VDVRRFLAEHPPFAALDPDALEALAAAAEVEFFPEGSAVGGAAAGRFVHVVRVGAIEVVDDGEVVDLLGEGDLFGAMGYGRAAEDGVRLRAHEDTLCYLFDVEATGRAFGAAPRSARVAAHVLPGAEVRWGSLSPVGSLVRRPPVTSASTATVAEVAQRMASERVSSVLIPSADGWGIVTDRDLRTRILAVGRSSQTPVGEVMSHPVTVVPADETAEETLLVMLERGFHHAPVVDASGHLVGMVTDTDLLALERVSPFALRTEIERAASTDDAVALGRRLPEVVAALVDAGMDAVAVGRVVSVSIDALTRAFLERAIAERGEPPAPWAWLAFGSQARHEQALHTDQDHGLVLDADHEVDDEVDRYFGVLALDVADGLERAGIPRCAGRVMAESRAMRRSVAGWRRAFEGWMRAPDRQGSVYTSIVFDYRRVAGPLDAVPALDEVVAEARTVPGFVRHLAHRALDERPPTGFLRHLVVEGGGEHAGRLDVKRRGVTLVSNIARLQAIRAGSIEKRTLSRLRAARSAGLLDPDAAEGLDEAFRVLWTIRLEHQRRRLTEGAEPDDFVDPAALGQVTRRALREAFGVIRGAQRALAIELDLR